jgi:16S rRNA processing protein RimM
MPLQRICVAKIGAAHGVRGEVRLFAYTQDPLAIRSYGELEDKSGARRFRIASARAGKGHIVARFEGIDDRDAAEKLTHIELYIPRSRLAKQENGDIFYHADLIGLSVETGSGEKFGELVGIHNFGAGDLLEIKPVSRGETVLLPFVDPYVSLVDLKGERIVVDPPAGLFEDTVNASRDDK